MNELQIFNYQTHEVRTVQKDGEPWFVLKDVCLVFGDTNYRRVAARLDDDEKGVSRIATHGGPQEMTIVNESGVYHALFTMQPKEARGVSVDYSENRKKQLNTFKRWVTHEVLPSIRRYGLYATPDTVEAMISDPDTAIELLTSLKEERAKRRELEAQAKEDKPKVIFANAVSTANTSILVGELAKIIKQNGVNIGQNRLFKWLRDNGYLIKRNGTDFNMPTQRSMEMGLFEIKETVVAHSDGHTSITKTPKVTGNGQCYFINKILGVNAGA